MEICRYKVKIYRSDAVFLYFILEANDNLSFFSTLGTQKGDRIRTVIVSSHISLSKELEDLLSIVKKKIPTMEYKKVNREEGNDLILNTRD